MTPCFEGLLEIAHVVILFGIDARVWKEDGKIAVKVSKSGCDGRVVRDVVLDIELHAARIIVWSRLTE